MTLAHAQFIVEHRPAGLDRQKQASYAIATGLLEAQRIAAELVDQDPGALDALDDLAGLPEGELTGPFGLVRFAPTA